MSDPATPPEDAEDMPLIDEITMRVEMTIDSLDHEVDVPEAPPADETAPSSEASGVADVLADGTRS